MTKTPATILTLAALAAVAMPAARADLKVVQTLHIDSPQLKAYMDSMTPEQRAKMSRSGNPLLSGAPQVTTFYVHGGKSRADVGPMSYVSDAATSQTTVINRRSHTYSTMQTPTGAGTGAGQIKATVKDSGQTKVIQGHPARRYLMTATLASQPGTVIQGDIWAAQDLARPSLPTTGGGPLAVFQSLLRNVKGFPLKTTLAITGSPLGSTTVTTSVVSVSKAPVPASAFAVPAGYTKAPMNAGQ